MAATRFVSEATFQRWMPSPVRKGDLVLTSEAPLGRVALVQNDEPLALGQRIFGLRGREGVLDTRFLYYAFQTARVREDLASRATGTTVLGIRQPELRKVIIPAPTYFAQLAIAEVLGALDDKIAASARLAEVADNLVAALFQKAIQAPGVRHMPFFDACDVRFGEPFAGAHFTAPDEGRPLIRIRDLKTFTSQVWTSESRPAETLIQAGDIVVGMDAEFRPTAWLGEPGLLNQRVCRCTGRGFGSAYLREALRAPLAAIEGSKSATTVIHLNKSDLMRASLPVAQPQALVAFEAEAEPIFTMRVQLASQDRQLRRMRDVLLPELMSGRLRVKDAERVVGEVV